MQPRRTTAVPYRRQRGGILVRLAIAAVMAVVALFGYFSASEYNPITGETQRVSLSPEQEIKLGLEAAPQMASQHGGLHPNRQAQQLIDQVGNRLATNSVAAESGWPFEFHLLADPNTVNAFALPGGQIFITQALFSRLQNEQQLAAVLAHEISHVLARHGAERVAKQQLTEGLTGAVVIASGDYSTGQMAAVVGQLVNMKYGRDDELESDRLGVKLMAQAGYDPQAMVEVMQILAAASQGRQPEFFSTHPNPDNRIENIREAIREQQALAKPS